MSTPTDQLPVGSQRKPGPPHRRGTSSALPPALIVGGSHNALSIARSLGRRGVRVHALNRADSELRWSRYVTLLRLPAAKSAEAAVEEYLLGPESETLRGAVLLAAGDEGLKLLGSRHPDLAAKFQLDLCNPAAQRTMLDKLASYEAARAAGVPTPKFWTVASRSELAGIRDELVFPLIVKPRHSHLFQQSFRAKFLVVERHEDLARALETVERAGVQCLLMEKIPGPDTLLCSYYTYLDENGAALFDFTKRILRRSPPNMGLATYHITDHVAGIKEPALRFFRSVGLQGVANVEFKLDPRDGELKLIECNARFTAANVLLEKCGLDLAWFVYCRVAGLAPPALSDFPDGLRLWDPGRDVKAFLQMRRAGDLGLLGWLRSILHRQTFPVFAWRDPMPALARAGRSIAGNARRRRGSGRAASQPHPIARSSESKA